MSDRKILIVDAHNAVWRLMKKLPVLSVDGKQVQVLYGFIRLLRGVMSQFEPTHVIVCWDEGRSKFRKKTYPKYKENRDHYRDKEHAREADHCYSQIAEIKLLLNHLNIIQAGVKDTEADDLIGLICCNIDGNKIVVSADGDMLQLVSKDTSVWSPMKSILYTPDNFKKYLNGLSPTQFLHMRALVGDTSDNISGVARGFGEQTATEVLKTYGSIEKLFTPKVEKKLVNKGNRYALLYEGDTRSTAYRNLLIMDLSICGNHIPNRDYILASIMDSLKHRKRIDKAAVKNIFLEKDFKSLLREFAVWIGPFEDLDWSKE